MNAQTNIETTGKITFQMRLPNKDFSYKRHCSVGVSDLRFQQTLLQWYDLDENENV